MIFLFAVVFHIAKKQRRGIMTQWKLRSKKSPTGKLLKAHSKKRRRQGNRDFLPALMGSTKRRKIRARGGNEKIIALAADTANVATKGGIKKAKILTVAENRANPQFVRRNIITKGAIIQTDLGKARVTSKPGQSGVVNAVLIELKAEEKAAK